MLMGRGKGSKVRISMGGSTTFQVTLNGGKQRGGGQSVPVRPPPLNPAPREVSSDGVVLQPRVLVGLTAGRCLGRVAD